MVEDAGVAGRSGDDGLGDLFSFLLRCCSCCSFCFLNFSFLFFLSLFLLVFFFVSFLFVGAVGVGVGVESGACVIEEEALEIGTAEQ